MQRLLWASTSTKDPSASDTLYVHGLSAPFTVDTMPDKTLIAFFEHGEVGEAMPADGGDCDAVLARFSAAGLDVGALAARSPDGGRRRSASPPGAISCDESTGGGSHDRQA